MNNRDIHTKKRKPLLIASIALCILLFTTCNVGLGETVDILPPEVVINYPENTAIIRDEFVMQGTVTDDFRVESVAVSFTLKDAIAGITPYQYSFPAVVDVQNNTWQLFGVNKKSTQNGIESPYLIKDGLYTVTALATDASGKQHSNTVDYTIDNTAPVVAMTTPGSDTDPENYGNVISIVGQVADDNIEKIVFSAYADASGTDFIASTSIDDFSGAIINNEIGRFSDDESLASFYNDILKKIPEENKDKPLYYTIQALDRARIYNGPQNIYKEGNSSTEYYLTADLETLESIDTNLIHSIRTETYYRTSSTEVNEDKKLAATTIEDTLKTIAKPSGIGVPTVNAISANTTFSSTQVTLATFTISPNAPPTFSYGAAFTGTRPPKTNDISATSSIDVNLHPNLDGSAHELDQFSIYVKELTENDTVKTIHQLYPLKDGTVKSSLEAGVLTLALPLQGVDIKTDTLPTNEQIGKPDNNSDSKILKHTPNEGIVFDLPTGSYIVEVVGSDFLGREYKNKDTDNYGFNKLASSTLPIFDVSATFPTITIIKPKAQNNEPVLVVKGSVTTSKDLVGSEHGMESVTLTLKESGSTENIGEPRTLLAGVDNENFTTINKKKYDFSIPLTHEDFGSTDTTKDYVLTLVGTDKDGVTTTENRYITYDVVTPIITLTAEIHSVVDSTKKLTLIIDATDDKNIASASDENGFSTTNYYTIGSEKTFFKANDLNNTTTITHEFIPDEKGLTITVAAQDEAGNPAEKTITLDTLAPVLWDASITNPIEPDYEQTINAGTNEEKTINWYGNKALTISIFAKDVIPSGEDNVEVASVEYSLVKVGDTSTQEVWMKLKKGQDITKPLEWTETIYPASTGEYVLSFRALDVNTNASPIEKVFFSVDKNTPSVPTSFLVNGDENIVSFTTNAKNNIIVTVNGLIEEGSGLKEIKLTKIGSVVKDEVLSYTPVNELENTYTITIPKESIAANANGVIEFTLTDNVENKTVYRPFSVIIDTIAPVVEITSPLQDETVNGTITIRGSTTDAYYSETVLQIKNDSNEWVDISDVLTSRVWTQNLYTTTYTTKAITLRAKAKDNAGNEAFSDERIIKIDQDLDRPEISITNAKLAGMNETDPAKLSLINQLRGSIVDDDGIKLLEIANVSDLNTELKDEDFEEVEVLPGGLWIYPSTDNPETSKLSDGEHNLYFRVTDATDKVFTSSKEESQTSPKITDGSNTFGYSNSTVQDTRVKLLVDTIPPELTLVEISTNGVDWRNFSDRVEIKGTFYLRITAQDASEIKGIVVKYADTLISTTTITTKEDETTNLFISTAETDAIDSITTKLPNTRLNLTLEITDSAGVSHTQRLTQMLIDNAAPTLSAVTSHAYAAVVTGNVVLAGSASDGNNSSGIKSIHFAFPTTDGANSNEWIMPEQKDVIEEGDTIWKEVSSGTSSWSITFDGSEKGYPTLSSYIGENGNNIAIETSSDSNIWRLPIVFRLEDYLGNVSYTDIPPQPPANPGDGYVVEDENRVFNHFELHVDPNGNKPTVSVSYPKPTGDANLILGGAITIFGSAKDNGVVSAVYMQIDTNGDGKFEDNISGRDAQLLEAKGYTIDRIEHFEPRPDGSDPQEWWGFKVDGTNNWKQVINASDELNNTTIRYRVRSVDLGDAVSDWSDPVIIEINDNVPTIGESEELTLVQYASGSAGEITRQQPYEDGIWLTGEWYLIGSIEDSAGISSVDVTGGIIGDETNGELFTIVNDFAPLNTSGYRMNIPLGTDDGLLTFTITATKTSNNETITTSRTIFVNHDNTAPSIATNLQHRDQDISKEHKVQQTDKTYSFGSTVQETGGGLSHIAFWFERLDVDGNESDRIYNVMEERTKVENGETITNRTDFGSGKLEMIDDLPRLRLTVDESNRVSENTLQHEKIVGNLNVRRGGLVTIAGVDRTITAVNHSAGTITFTPSANTAYTTADIAYVLLVNNQGSIETMRDDGTIVNDDGDGMLEFLERQGSNYTWSASIDSRNIPDGPIRIHAVAYDMSGNYTKYTVAESIVSNNAPAISKVWLGTDINANGEIEPNEETEYSTLNDDNEAVVSATVDASSGDNKFTATGLTHVTAEIVGGNGDLHYSLSSEGYAGIAVDTVGKTTRIRKDDGSFQDGEALASRVNAIELKVVNDKLLGAIDDTTGEACEFIFKIWDSTEESTVGNEESGSQKADLTVKMHIDVLDDVGPNTVISPFYWEGEDNNSLYLNSQENGHIDLTDDLPDAFDNTKTGIDDRDPKVSGKVTLKGTAYDDKALREIWAQIGGFNFAGGEEPATALVKIATYTPATEDEEALWDIHGASMDLYGWDFSVTKDSIDQTGHKVEWTLHWDSQKIAGVVGLDKTITISAKDASGNDTVNEDVTGKDPVTNEEIVINKPTYRVDVVPYITKVSTKISKDKSTNARTALGKYVVTAGETGIIIDGFNFADTNNNTVTLGTEEIAENVAGVDNTVTVQTEDASDSGEVTLSVNGIETLNNRNNNNKDYNKMSMANNDSLDDDVAFDVWEFNDITNKPSANIMDLELRVNPDNGMLGFAFVDTYHFYMPNASKSQAWYATGEGPYWESALAYSPNGRAYGLTANQNKWINGNTPIGSYVTVFTSGKTVNILGTGVGHDVRVQRLLSPVMAATAQSTSVDNIYLAYFDTIDNQLRYQYGTYNASSFGGQLTNHSGTTTAASTTKYSIIKELPNGTDYVSLDARKFTSGDLVVITWYDKSNGTLQMAYNNINPRTDSDDIDEAIKNGWKYKEIDTGGSGAHNMVKIDSKGGIHIAYHTTKGLALKYAYVTLPATAEGEITKNIVTVDSYAVTGTQVRLDIAKNGNNIVPYISYYEGGVAKIAYQVQFGTTAREPALNGVEKNKFTKNWEVSVVPSLSVVKNDSVNVGVYKDPKETDDTQIKIPTFTGDKYGGNDTMNPVVAYINGSGNVEMAQKR